MPRLAALALALLGTTACKRPPQGSCPFDLGGTWVNANDERYAYRLTDRGGTISGELYLRQPDGSATPRAAGEAPITLSLARGPAEVAGTMRSPARTPAGKECQVDFSVRLASCQSDALQVVAELSAPLDEACQRLRHLPDGGAVPPDLAEYTWIRSSVRWRRAPSQR